MKRLLKSCLVYLAVFLVGLVALNLFITAIDIEEEDFKVGIRVLVSGIWAAILLLIAVERWFEARRIRRDERIRIEERQKLDRQ